jgi:methyl-accepting chemotaxis protein
VSRIMQEITLASRTQTDDIAQLHQAIERIDGDTQQNAARVEETAAVAQSLRSQVEALLDAVGSFTIEAQASHQAARTAPRSSVREPNPAESVDWIRPAA